MKKKGYAWKACNRHKRFPSSNLGHSAQKTTCRILIYRTLHCFLYKVRNYCILKDFTTASTSLSNFSFFEEG